MGRDKRSFFERLTGSVSIDDYDDAFEEEMPETRHIRPTAAEGGNLGPQEINHEERLPEEEVEGQLTVDMYQTDDAIIIRALVAGTRPDDLDVSITRDMVTIRGKREEGSEISEENYYYRELYWGSFSRTILLPQEIDTDGAEAKEKHGMLIITLPKIDKEKQTKLKVKAS